MTIIQTVLGTIPPVELGATYCHDHLYFVPPPPYDQQDPDLRLDSLESAIQELKYFKTAGGGALVEMSTPEMGRAPEKMRAMSAASGVHIIAVTGYNKAKFSEAVTAHKSVEQLVEEEVRDLTVGMDGTDIKAGAIKASSSRDGMTPGEVKLFQAAAIAHLQTGAPITTHTEGGTYALEQISMLTAAGVQPQHMLIGHLDLRLDWDFLQAVAQTGVFMGFDQISKEKYFPDALRIQMIKRLVEAGHGGQVMLSGDLARASYWPSNGFGKGPGLTYILWRFVPWMLEVGIPRPAIDDMLIHNPARAFAWAK